MLENEALVALGEAEIVGNEALAPLKLHLEGKMLRFLEFASRKP